MKKVDGIFIPSATDKKRAQSHCNALARKAAYDGCIEAWMKRRSGEIRYIELLGRDYIEAGPDWMLLAYAYTPRR